VSGNKKETGQRRWAKQASACMPFHREYIVSSTSPVQYQTAFFLIAFNRWVAAAREKLVSYLVFCFFWL